MKNSYWIRSMLRRALALTIGAMLPCLAMAASVSIFSPEGKIADVQQVRVSFDEPMLPLGSINTADPFTIACPMQGRAHWINQNTWVWDLPAADPQGQKCTFTLRDDLKTLSGKPLTGKRVFGFELPELSYNQRIRIAYVEPYGGLVREDQLFLVTFDHPILAPQPALYCVADDQQRRPVQIDDAVQDQIRQGKLGRQDSSLAVRCPGTLTESSQLHLVLDRGAGRDTSTFGFQVRGPVAASIECVRIDTPACVPGRALSLNFNSVIPEQLLRDIRLRTASGTFAGTTHIIAAQQFSPGSSAVNFDLNLDPDQSYQVEYPPNMVDADGRIALQRNLPSEIKTSHALAIVGFEASNFAMVRRSSNSSLKMLMEHHAKPAHLSELVVGNEPDLQAADESMLEWLDHPQVWTATYHFFKNPEKFRTREVRSDHADSLSLPLREAGLHVFLTAQSIATDSAVPASLQKELDAGAVPEAVTAIATRMAVYLKTSQENGAVWVSYLDDGKPVAKAKVRIYDQMQHLIWEGNTDASGLARIPQPMQQSVYYTAIVRATDRDGKNDISITRTGWDDPIRSNTAYWFYGRGSSVRPGVRADSILDRSLVKPGEKISMRSVIRSETSSGLAYLSPANRPTTLRVAHTSSGQHWDFPLKWDDADDALTVFDVPTGAPLGGYGVTLLWGSADSPANQIRSGSFSVEAYRVPSLAGDLSVGNTPVLVGSTPTVSLNMHYQDGSPATSLAVKLSATLNRGTQHGLGVPGFEEIASPQVARTDFWPRDDKPVVLHSQQLTLDKDGKAAFTLPPLPKVGDDYSLHLEATYLDTSGEVQTITRSLNVRRSPLRLQVGVFGIGNVGSTAAIRVRSIADDDSVRQHEKVTIRAEFGNANQPESRTPLGVVCAAVTDATGSASCFFKLSKSGNYTFIASAKDELGHEVASEGNRWVYENGNKMKDLFLSADKLQYQAGDVAHIQVDTPFDVSRAWLAVEREGVISSKIITLTGPRSEIEVPIDASYGPDGLHLVFVQRMLMRILLARGAHTAQHELLRLFFDCHQPALHQRRQCGLRHATPSQPFAQLPHRQPPLDGCQLRHNRQLILIQLWNPGGRSTLVPHLSIGSIVAKTGLGRRPGRTLTRLRQLRSKDRHSNHSPRIALFRDRLAFKPLLAHHPLKQRTVRRSRRAQRAHLGRLAIFQIVQHRILAILLLRRQLRPPRRTLRRALIQYAPPRRCDPVHPLPLHLRGQRQHAAQHLANWRAIILSDPPRQLQQRLVQQRSVVHHRLNRLCLDAFGQRIIMQPQRHSHQPLPGKRHNHPRPHARRHAVHRIGKRTVEGNRQCNIAVKSHITKSIRA